MALKKKEEVKKSRLVEVLLKDYKWENLLLAVLATVASALSLLILTGTLTIDASFPVLGQSPNDKIFSWVLLVIAVLGLVIVVAPFIMPATSELKKISWPKWLVFLDNAVRVIIFMVLITVMLLGFDAVLQGILSKLPTD